MHLYIYDTGRCYSTCWFYVDTAVDFSVPAFRLRSIFFIMKIYIGNLHGNVSEEQVREMFAPFGNVINVNIMMDVDSGRSECFGFVEIDDEDQGYAAIQHLNNKNFMGRYLRVEAAPSF